MIVTLTANPSLDRTIEVDRLTRGEVLRATGTGLDPGGKGINVARALARHGMPVRAVFPCGGSTGDQLRTLLEEWPIELTPVPIAGDVRANITVAEPDGTVTKLNEPGPTLGEAEVQALVDATIAAARGARWLVLSGSLPPGAPVDFYARLLEHHRAIGARVALDASGPSFAAALPFGPDLIKPNQDELAEASGRRINTVGDAVDAARLLCERGAGAVVASLGAAGAVLVSATDPGHPVHAVAPVDRPRSTVGAGDTALAGFLFAGGEGPDAILAAVCWGAAATALPGSGAPGPDDVARARARSRRHDPIDLDLPLTHLRLDQLDDGDTEGDTHHAHAHLS